MKTRLFIPMIKDYWSNFQHWIEKNQTSQIIFIYWLIMLFFICNTEGIKGMIGYNKLFFLISIPAAIILKLTSKVFFVFAFCSLVSAFVLTRFGFTEGWGNASAVICMNSILMGLVVLLYEIRKNRR